MKIADVCVERPVFAVMLIAFLVTLGIFSFRSLGVDLFPRADPATVNVNVSLPGASPDEMTSSVVLPLEDAISSVSGLDEMMSRASEGSASITSTFKLERDIEGATQDIREKVAGALRNLPPNILPPVIAKVDPDSDPILTVVVSGQMERRELTEIADKIVRRGIQTIDGVGEVNLIGGQSRQVRVLIDAQRLTAHGLTVIQLRDAIVNENVEEPGGRMIHGPEQVDLRTMGRITSAGQFGDIIIAYRGGAPIRVRDVARVEDSAEELRVWARLDGNDVVSVQVTRQMGTNTVQIAEEVKRRVELLKKQVPPGVHLQIIGDISNYIKASVDSLLEHLILGSVLASIVVLLFIRNLRAVIIASVAIPASVISTFTLMKYMNFTLNNMTLLVSFTLTPMMSSRLLKVKESGEHARSRESKFAKWIDHSYLRALEWSLDHRARIIAVCAGVFLLTFPLYHLVGRDWIPTDDQNEINASVDFPEGQSLDRTIALLSDIAKRVGKIREVVLVEPYSHGLTYHGHLYIGLADRSKRKRTSTEVAEDVRKIILSYPNTATMVRLPSVLGGENYTPIRAIIRGPDIQKLAEFGQRATLKMAEYPGMLDVNPDMNLNKPELQVKVDRQRAADLGVRMADIGSAVRLMYSGEDEISTYKEGAEQYSVTIQLLPEQRDNPDVLAQLMVPSAKQGQVRLENVATIERGNGPLAITRYNRQFQVSITANVTRGYPLDAAAEATRNVITSRHLPPGYAFGFSGPVRILDETTLNMILAVLLASIFMYMVLAAQFESFTYPFIIMLTLPLSIPFALFSLWITHRSLNLWSSLGVFLLLGIVKKNGILQVDYTNRLRSEGMPQRQALIEANRVRLRPILMTTFSIVAGLIPVAIGLGAGSEQRAAIAVTIIGGQTLCLILTLLVVPVAYSYLAHLTAISWSQYTALFWGRLRMQLARRFGLF